MRILFVCTGNTCRSPMAEVLCRRIAEEPGRPAVEARSAGTHTREGMPASGGAIRAAGRHGLSLEEHASTPLSPDLVEWADLILAMGPSHLRRVLELGGLGKGVLLGAFASGGFQGDVPGGDDSWAVPDPYGGDDAVYEETFRTLERYVDAAMKRLSVESEE